MASRSIFAFTILLSLVLVSCRPFGSSDIADRLIDSACRKTTDFSLCVSTLKSGQRRTAAHPRGLAKILAKRTLSRVDKATAYIEKIFYIQPDMVVREYLAYCLDDYAKAQKKLRLVQDTLARRGGDYREVHDLMSEIASLAADCQETFERKQLQSDVDYKPPRPCPLSQQNKSIQVMAEAAAGLLP